MIRAALISLAFLIGAPALAQEFCPVKIDFSNSQQIAAWQAVNDGVMGGRSSGAPRFDNGVMIFEGVINTNGGGFSSLRAGVQDGLLSGQTGMKIRVKSDGRDYKLTLRTDAFYRGRRVAFQAPVPQTQLGEWAEVTVPFLDLAPSIFGRPLRGPVFMPEEARQVGIIISDGKDGPFRLEVDWIKSCVL